MNREFELKLQAYLDGELSAPEALQVEAMLAEDQNSQALRAELQHSKSILAGNELERKVPVTADFFWAQIERQINQLERGTVPAASPRWLARWWKLLAPACAVALLAGVFLQLRQGSPQEPALASIAGMESEAAAPDTSVITFRSDVEGVSVVWVNTE